MILNCLKINVLGGVDIAVMWVTPSGFDDGGGDDTDEHAADFESHHGAK